MENFLTSGLPDILKVIQLTTHVNDNKDIKYIFVGEHQATIIEILDKLENNESLSKEEDTELNNTIPYWKVKFGNLDDYQIKFIYKIIHPTVIVKNLVIYLVDKLNIPSRRCILFSYVRNVKYSLLYEVASYIFYKTGLTTKNVNITDIKNIAKTYNIGDHTLFDNIEETVTFTKEELIGNKAFQEYVKTVPYIYNTRYYYKDEITPDVTRDNYSYEYINLLSEFTKNGNITYEDQQKFLSLDNSRIDDIIDYNNNSVNNTLYIIATDELINHYTSKGQQINNLKLYIENNTHDYNKVDIELIALNRRLFSNWIQLGINNKDTQTQLDKLILSGQISKNQAKHICTESILDIKDVYQKNWVVDGYDMGINMELDLINIFRDLEPNHYLPLIKYISDGQVQLYNVYKPFFRNINEKIKLYFIAGKDRIQLLNENINVLYDKINITRMKHLIYQDYLLFKWRIDDVNMLNIYLFKSGYVIAEYQTLTYLKLDESLNISVIINKILGKIKNKYKLNYELLTLNPEKAVKMTPGTVFLCENININYKFELSISDKYYESFDKLLDSGLMKNINKRIRNFNNIIVLPGSVVNKIKFIYTDTYGFYSLDNIKHYIRNFMISKGNKLKSADKDTLINNLKKIFSIDTNIIDKLLTELDTINLQTKDGLLFHISCELELDKSNNQFILYINVPNMNGYTIVSAIFMYLEAIIKDSMFNTSYSIKADLTMELKSMSKSKKVEEKLIFDINDIENMDLVDLENIDLSAFEEIRIDNVDNTSFDVNIDMDLVDRLQKIEENIIDAKLDTPTDVSDMRTLQDIKLKQLVGNKEKMTVVNYMKEMRRIFDQNLYEPVVKGKKTNFVYERGCSRTDMRQPFIVTKDQIKEIEKEDPESITGYMKYRGNYYICPRIWDARMNKPISARRFIANGLKSPYTNGESVLEGPTKNLITDKYTVIIRQPTTSKNWSDPTKYKDWPDALKRTEKDAFPALSYSNKHPAKCVPCCFINIPEDYDPNKKELQQFFKPYNYQKCEYNANLDILDTKVPGIDTYCKIDEYISNSTTVLKNCRLGLLTEELNVLLNNNQELFLNANETALNDNANLFLRMGIQFNNITNILDSFAAILELRTDKLISHIVNKLTPLEFIKLNNGELINIFCSNTELPITPSELTKFTDFIKIYNTLFEYFNLDVAHILDVLNGKNYEYINQTKVLYKISSAFYNYLGYISSTNEIKSINYLIDIFAKPHKWMFKSGLNIIIFNKMTNQIQCLDNFNYKSKQIVIFIEEEPDTFIPVVHVTNKYGKLKTYGLINLDNEMNLNNSQIAGLYKSKPTMTKLIESSKDRLNNIIKLLYIQSGLCNYNLVNFFTKLEKTILFNKLAITAQYQGIGNSAQVEYINVNDKYILPIYPHSFIKHAKIGDYVKLHEDLKTIGLTFNMLIDIVYNEQETAYLANYGYGIEEALLDKINGNIYICAVTFANGLIMSLHPVEYIPSTFGELRSAIYKKFNHMIKIRHTYTINLLKTFFDPRYINNIPNAKNTGKSSKSIEPANLRLTESIFNLLGFINEVLKNNISSFISKNQKSKEIIKFIHELKQGQTNVYNILDELNTILTKYIIKLDNISFHDYIKMLINTGINSENKVTLRKDADVLCNKSIYNSICFKDTDKDIKDKLIISTEVYSIVILGVLKDLMNNKLELEKIIKGQYIIPINDMFMTKLGTIDAIFNKFNTNLIISADELAFLLSKNVISKYKTNFKLEPDMLDLQVLNSLDEEQMVALKDFVFSDINQRLTSALGLASLLSSISSSNITDSSNARENVILSTVFNKDGMFNPNAQHSECKFPFRDKRGNINYKCIRASDAFKDKQKGIVGSDIICATELNKDKTIKNWGYCPEKQSATFNRLQKAPLIDAFSPDNKNKKIGDCSFPFIYHNKNVVNPLTGLKPFIKISYTCEENTAGHWCYVRNKETNVTVPLIGTSDHLNIFKGRWSMGALNTNPNKSGFITINNKLLKAIPDIMGYTEGMCSFKADVTEIQKLEELLDLTDVTPIKTLDDYNPDYCLLSTSKKGYTKKQLYLFGKNVLNIPYKQLLKNNRILNKPELCEMFNGKIREIKKTRITQGTDNIDYNEIYRKDPALCLWGQTKGGYKLTELRDMAITFFGLDEKTAYNMSKDSLCNYIIPIVTGTALSTVTQGPDDTEEGVDGLTAKKYVDIDTIYPKNKNINLCTKPIKRGGLRKADVNMIAKKYFGINIIGKSKKELCKLIQAGVENIKKTNDEIMKDDNILINRKDVPDVSNDSTKITEKLLKDLEPKDLERISF